MELIYPLHPRYLTFYDTGPGGFSSSLPPPSSFLVAGSLPSGPGGVRNSNRCHHSFFNLRSRGPHRHCHSPHSIPTVKRHHRHCHCICIFPTAEGASWRYRTWTGSNLGGRNRTMPPQWQFFRFRCCWHWRIPRSPSQPRWPWPIPISVISWERWNASPCLSPPIYPPQSPPRWPWIFPVTHRYWTWLAIPSSPPIPQYHPSSNWNCPLC